jgi:hypothetical protein
VDEGKEEQMKLSMFERFLLLVIMQIMFVAGIPVAHRRELSDLLYRVAMKGEIEEKDFQIFG